MRALLIHQIFVSPDEAGGTRHYELGRHCVASGHEFTIVASNQCYYTGKQKIPGTKLGSRIVVEEQINGIRALRCYTSPAMHRNFFWRVVSYLSFMFTSIWAGLKAGPVDVVIGTSPPIFQLFSAWIISVIRRRPLIVEIRDLWPEFAIDMGILSNPILIKLTLILESFMYNRATHIVVNSPAFVEHLVKNKKVPQKKISLVPNGSDPDMFDPNDQGETFRHELSLEGKFIVTYAGALGIANDISTILRAADTLKDNQEIVFLLVGDGKERKNLEQEAKKLNLNNVRFVGVRQKSEMCDVLAAADVCVATLQNIKMFRTVYPNKIFDYMAAGRPIALGIDGVIRDVVTKANAGISFQPGNSDQLAAAVLELFNNREKAVQLGTNGRKYVVEYFNRHLQVKQFCNLIQRVASRGLRQ